MILKFNLKCVIFFYSYKKDFYTSDKKHIIIDYKYDLWVLCKL